MYLLTKIVVIFNLLMNSLKTYFLLSMYHPNFFPENPFLKVGFILNYKVELVVVVSLLSSVFTVMYLEHAMLVGYTVSPWFTTGFLSWKNYYEQIGVK